MFDIRRHPTEERANIYLKGEEKVMDGVQKKKKPRKLAIFVSVVFILMIVCAGSAAYYYYSQYQRAMKNPVVENKSEAQSITDTIGKFMELPEGEEPTLATVTDVEKIKDQPFFTGAQNGDKVLIYSKSGKAILYRPSIGKIIEVSTVSGIDENTAPENPITPNQNAENQNLENVPTENVPNEFQP